MINETALEINRWEISEKKHEIICSCSPFLALYLKMINLVYQKQMAGE